MSELGEFDRDPYPMSTFNYGPPQPPRMTFQTVRTLSAFCSKPSKELSGAEFMQSSGLSSGTLYPILMRLDEAGWLESRWENVDPSDVRRPRRRLYRITALGRRCYVAAMESLLARVST